MPSISEVRSAPRKLQSVGRNGVPPRKYCFFIDGLDEFSGSYDIGISHINLIASGSNIKVIISSRPIPPCVAAFSAMPPHLQLQDLTRDDIRAFIDEMIGGHSYMDDLQSSESKKAPRIQNDAVENLPEYLSGLYWHVGHYLGLRRATISRTSSNGSMNFRSNSKTSSNICLQDRTEISAPGCGITKSLL